MKKLLFAAMLIPILGSAQDKETLLAGDVYVEPEFAPGAAERHPIAVPSVAPIGSGRDYDQDQSRAENFRFLEQDGFASNMVEASIRFALSKKEVSTVLVGYSDLNHLEEAVEYAAKGPLPTEALARLPDQWSKFVGN